MLWFRLLLMRRSSSEQLSSESINNQVCLLDWALPGNLPGLLAMWLSDESEEAFSLSATSEMLWNKQNWLKFSFLSQQTSYWNDVFEPNSSTAYAKYELSLSSSWDHISDKYFSEKWCLDNLRNLLVGLLIIYWEKTLRIWKVLSWLDLSNQSLLAGALCKYTLD